VAFFVPCFCLLFFLFSTPEIRFFIVFHRFSSFYVKKQQRGEMITIVNDKYHHTSVLSDLKDSPLGIVFHQCPSAYLAKHTPMELLLRCCTCSFPEFRPNAVLLPESFVSMPLRRRISCITVSPAFLIRVELRLYYTLKAFVSRRSFSTFWILL
jgi:hypothetical protein